jgi:hypothetical protein
MKLSSIALTFFCISTIKNGASQQIEPMCDIKFFNDAAKTNEILSFDITYPEKISAQETYRIESMVKEVLFSIKDKYNVARTLNQIGFKLIITNEKRQRHSFFDEKNMNIYLNIDLFNKDRDKLERNIIRCFEMADKASQIQCNKYINNYFR